MSQQPSRLCLIRVSALRDDRRIAGMTVPSVDTWVLFSGCFSNAGYTERLLMGWARSAQVLTAVVCEAHR